MDFTGITAFKELCKELTGATFLLCAVLYWIGVLSHFWHTLWVFSAPVTSQLYFLFIGNGPTKQGIAVLGATNSIFPPGKIQVWMYPASKQQCFSTEALNIPGIWESVTSWLEAHTPYLNFTDGFFILLLWELKGSLKG